LASFLHLFRPAKLIITGGLKVKCNFTVEIKYWTKDNSHMNFGRIFYLDLKLKMFIIQLHAFIIQLHAIIQLQELTKF
jgi:hypothetical protein